MTLTKKQVKRVYVTARDPDTGESKTTTVYETTPESFIDAIKTQLQSEPRKMAENVKAGESASSDCSTASGVMS